MPPTLSKVALTTSVVMSTARRRAAAAGVGAGRPPGGGRRLGHRVAGGTSARRHGAAAPRRCPVHGAAGRPAEQRGLPVCLFHASHSRTSDIVKTTHSRVRRISVMEASSIQGDHHRPSTAAGEQAFERPMPMRAPGRSRPGTTGCSAAHASRQQAAAQRAMAVQRVQRVLRTGGVEAADVADPGAEQQPVGAHQQAGPRGTFSSMSIASGRPRARRAAPARWNSCCKFAPRRVAQASEAADTNWSFANGVRRRTSHSPAAACLVSGHHAADLPPQQVARHRPARVALGNHAAQPMAVGELSTGA
jgi:hypothetical protein